MKVARRCRHAAKRRWRPSLNDIVRRTLRKRWPRILDSMIRNNALLARL
ncbi:hypothetical protein KDX14_33165 [Burkholderia cenocepacia]|nr:hypothetical protein [Burkholderia cenocepacia]MBR8074377.1 hypothetical protein [Burkholderia cenocepacia]